MKTYEGQIKELLTEHGPMTGGRLAELLGEDSRPILIWKTCMSSDDLRIFNCARYYLRYDVTRDDQIRLSPSVLRDFLSFTLVYLSDQHALAVDGAAILANKHRLISLRKLKFARNSLLSLSEDIQTAIQNHACCFIAGDISYFLSHDEPRVHQQTGSMIRGSDIDIIVVHVNDFDPDTVREAERQLLGIKFRAIKDPAVAQEIDFIFKPVQKMFSQFNYADINQKIACKILYESFFLYGRLDLYEKLLTELEFSGAVKRIELDFEKALQGRKKTIGKILSLDNLDPENMDDDIRSLFYFSQERLEFQ